MLYYFALLSIIISSLLAVYNWKVQKNALLIAGILIVLSTYALTHYYTDADQSDFSLAILYGTLSPLWLLPGPFLYFYFRSIITPAKIWHSWKDALHFIPSLIQLVNILPYILSPFAYKLQVAHAIHENLNSIQTININWLYTFKTAFLSRPISLLFYLLWSTLLFLRQVGKVNSRTRIWLICFIFSLLITTAAYLYVALNLFSTSFQSNSIHTNPIYITSGIAYIFLPIALILFFPEVLYGMKNIPGPQSPKKSSIPPNELAYYQDLAKKIEQYCHTEKPYLQPSFEIADVAKAMQVPQKHIPITCQYAYNKKFTEIRTLMRIEHAKQLLQNGLSNNITIDAIGTTSGFKSRSTFYEAFKAETGMTPSQYLENLA
jgi:AraC-like DNA-binding protein